MDALKLRRKIKRKKGKFKRQEYFKQANLKSVWRKPKGRKSKMRMNEVSRGKQPSPGFGSPRSVRGLSPQGLEEVRVFNPSQLTTEMKNKALVIASTVGKRKKQQMVKKAKELGLYISNL